MLTSNIVSSGDPLETLRRGSPDFLAKSLVIPAIYTKFKLMAHKFCINAWNYQWFSPKNPETPCGGSPGGLRTISAGTTLLGHTVIEIFVKCSVYDLIHFAVFVWIKFFVLIKQSVCLFILSYPKTTFEIKHQITDPFWTSVHQRYRVSSRAVGLRCLKTDGSSQLKLMFEY